MNGSSIEAAQSSIEGLSKTIGEAASGIGRGAKTFEQYGLKAKNVRGEVKSTTEIMGDVADKMEKMSKAEQMAMLSKLGIDSSMIQTLRLGRKALEEEMERRKALTFGVGTAENAKTAADFNDAMTTLSQIFKSLGEYLALRLAPIITEIAEAFADFAAENGDLFTGFLDVIGSVLGFLFDFIRAIGRVIEGFLAGRWRWAFWGRPCYGSVKECCWHLPRVQLLG
ncbi:hypothetical protein A4G19_15910 [Pasteurellaceae bacterium Macca]|nr:hypothetical protein [Pasteurellaceae bacterium Macca]